MKYSALKNGLGKNSKILIYTVSLFAIILWGISYIWTNQLIALDIPVTYFVFVRILLAGFVLFLLNAASGRIAKIKRKDLPKFLLLAFFEPFIYFICESYGVKETGSPTLSAMIIATIPIFSIGAGMLFFKERVNAVNVAGILLCLGGIVLVVMSKGALGRHFIFGVVLLLIAVLSEVGHASVTKSLSGNYTSQVIVMYQFLIGSVYLLPLFIFKGLDGFSARYLSVSKIPVRGSVVPSDMPCRTVLQPRLLALGKYNQKPWSREIKHIFSPHTCSGCHCGMDTRT